MVCIENDEEDDEVMQMGIVGVHGVPKHLKVGFECLEVEGPQLRQPEGPAPFLGVLSLLEVIVSDKEMERRK